MPEETKTYSHEGKQVEGESIAFTTEGEQWCIYQLSDGSTLKIKLVLMDVVRLAAVDDTGNPVYLIAAQQVLGVMPNPELQKKVEVGS